MKNFDNFGTFPRRRNFDVFFTIAQRKKSRLRPLDENMDFLLIYLFSFFFTTRNSFFPTKKKEEKKELSPEKKVVVGENITHLREHCVKYATDSIANRIAKLLIRAFEFSLHPMIRVPKSQLRRKFN